MISRFKILLNKMFSKRSTGRYQDLIQQGNLRIGNGCNIDALSIQQYESSKNMLNVEIGNDCFLNGTIVLHTKNSKIKIGDRVFIGPNTTLFCYDRIEIKSDVMISWGCTFIDTNAHSLKSEERKSDVTDWIKGYQYKNWSVVESKPIIVKEKCWVGFNSIITKGVVLAEGTVVASGSVVTKNTEDYDVIGGNPASFIKKTV